MIDRGSVEAGSDLCDAEIASAQWHLTELLRIRGRLSGCTSYIQRRMQIGYNHAARIMDYLEAARFISDADSNGERHLR